MSAPRSSRKPRSDSEKIVTAAPIEADGIAAPTAILAAIPLTLRWRDLDAFNHVNNSSFLTYLEEARLRWLQGVEGTWFSESSMPVMAAAHINYRAQLGWPGEIVVHLACTRIGNSSLTIAHRIVAADAAERLYADGDVVLVWVDPASGKAVALPDAIRRACSG